MYILITYDVEARRTALFRKVLSRYLLHEQNSVFGGDLTEAWLLMLHRDLARIAAEQDRIFQVEAPNRHNVSVSVLRKAPGSPMRACKIVGAGFHRHAGLRQLHRQPHPPHRLWPVLAPSAGPRRTRARTSPPRFCMLSWHSG